jgi:glycosyltransferase involved in cell wall biosynthesis
MKIGLIIYGSPDTISGGYLYDRMVVSHLRARGDEVAILSLPARGYASRLADNLRFRLPAGFDLVLQDELTHLSLLASNARKREIPVISIVHNLHASEVRAGWKKAGYQSIERQYLRSVDGYIFNSQATRESVEALNTAPKPSVVATPGGDRLGSWSREKIAKRAHEPGPLRLLFLANVTALKGLRAVLEALASLPAGMCKLDVVGSCEVEPEYAREMQSRASGSPSRVTFHGALDGQPLTQIMKRAQVMVVPSYYEGFGIAYLEGMAFGMPAMATTAGAIPELVAHGKNGYLVTPGDSHALAKHIEALALDRALLVRMGGWALQCFESKPTWGESAEAVRKFLIRAADEHISNRAE